MFLQIFLDTMPLFLLHTCKMTIFLHNCAICCSTIFLYATDCGTFISKRSASAQQENTGHCSAWLGEITPSISSLPLGALALHGHNMTFRHNCQAKIWHNVIGVMLCATGWRNYEKAGVTHRFPCRCRPVSNRRSFPNLKTENGFLPPKPYSVWQNFIMWASIISFTGQTSRK